MQSRLNELASNRHAIMLIGLSVAFIALIPRIDGAYYVGKYLWAEDGNIFISQAQSLGLSSLWTAYAGYLNIYPRVFAFVGSFFGLEAITYVYLAGWAIAFALLAIVVIDRAASLGLHLAQICLLLALIALQPVRGEVFFNITNTQWILAPALALYLLVPDESAQSASIPACLLLTVGCLTGPFSLLLAPLLILQGLILKDFKARPRVYVIVLLCALIQLVSVIWSGRIETPAGTLDFHHLAYTAGKLFSFHANSGIKYLAAFVFWAGLVFTIILLARSGPPAANARLRVSLLVLGAGVVHILAALYVFKNSPASLYVWGGTRYTWVPYTLFLVAAIAASAENKKLQGVLFLSMAALAVLNFQPVSPANQQFASYLNFSNYRPVSIPLNPRYAIHPEWQIDSAGFEPNPDKRISAYAMPPDLVAEKGALFFNQPLSCPGAKDIGVEVDLFRSKAGWMLLFWDSAKNFTGANSIRRYLPGGEVRTQFAFPNSAEALYLRFDPLFQEQGEVQIKQMLVYCLP